jgi:hypothetical protein
MATGNRSAPMVETISNEILCTMTGDITWSTFGHTSKFLPMRSVYIAGIKYTTASSGAMFCPPITRSYSQLFLDLLSLRPIQTSRLQPARTFGCRFMCGVCEPQWCKNFLDDRERMEEFLGAPWSR